MSRKSTPQGFNLDLEMVQVHGVLGNNLQWHCLVWKLSINISRRKKETTWLQTLFSKSKHCKILITHSVLIIRVA